MPELPEVETVKRILETWIQERNVKVSEIMSDF
ncbi:DNA-formamidopyrimidine glycosylase family protein [Blautia sp. An249]